MKRLIPFFFLVPSLLFAQTIHNTKSKFYVDTQDSATTSAYWNAINVKTFGAIGNGIIDDRTAIQTAINYAHTQGGGTVYIPRGTYRLTGATHPLYGSANTCLYLYSNIALVGAPGYATTLKRADAQVEQQFVISNYGYGAQLDSNIVIQDIIVDGNGPNNPVSASHAQYGINFNAASFCSFIRVKVKSIVGTGASGGTGESACFEGSVSDHFTYSDCVAEGYANSSSGFSYDGSTFGKYTNCTSHGFGIGMGFTHNDCRNILYANCVAYLNTTAYGFNSEYSGDIEYVNCISGSRSARLGTYLYGANTNLGNYIGWVIRGDSAQVTLTNCISTYNSSHGAYLIGDTSGTKINGGSFSHNGGYGIQYENDCANVVIMGAPAITGNATAPIRAYGSNITDADSAVAINGKMAGKTTFKGSGALISMRSSGGTVGYDFRSDGAGVQPTSGKPWIDTDSQGGLTFDVGVNTQKIYFNNYIGIPTTIGADGTIASGADISATSSTGQVYVRTKPLAGQQSGFIAQSGSTAKWGLFNNSLNGFEIYNYKQSTQAVKIDSVGNFIFNEGSIVGDTLIRGTVSFSGANARVAKYVPGASASDVVVVTGISSDGTTAPSALDRPDVICKADSIIFIRGVGGTSGKSINWMRMK